MRKYGSKPVEVERISVRCQELMYYQYLPVKMAGTNELKYEERLKCFDELIDMCTMDFLHRYGARNWVSSYVYLTAKRRYVGPNNHMNRPGYHCDGFMTEDINYIWSDVLPTVFNRGPFEVDQDHERSLAQFEAQALVMGEFSYAPNTLLRLDQYCVHRTAEVTRTQLRTFFKLSFSKERYNLEGNSHNYLFNYDWPMVPRKENRNHTSA